VFTSGGPFYSARSGVRYNIATSRGDFTRLSAKGVPTNHYTWNGPILFPPAIVALFNKESVPKLAIGEFSDLNRYGAEAISSCSPANPASEVGTGVSEIYTDGLPSLPGIPTWRDRTNLAKAAGSEFLNKEFGWEPLISEVKSFASVVQRHRDILNQYSRNAGTNVRRQFHFPLEKTFSDTSSTMASINVGGAQSGTAFGEQEQPGEYSITRGEEVKRWFSGSFTYMVPSQTDSWQRALGYGSEADILFGASLNPTLLWNLTPWSWAVDWFSDTGDIINNISNVVRAGQVMRYGYIMEERKTFIRYTVLNSGFQRIEPGSSMEKFQTLKRRAQANPYGFGIDLSELSPTRLAIIAALGITLV